MTRAVTLTSAALVILSATTLAASAHERFNLDRAYGGIQAERDRQRAQVEQGRNDGSITWLEKYTINREQARIDALEREALADGRLSRDEHRNIRQAQDDATRHIRAERRDDQVRGWWWRLWH